MIRPLLIVFATLFSITALGQAQADLTSGDEVLEAAWGAALVLPDEKQARLKPFFVSMAARSGGETLMRQWAQKLSSDETSVTEGGDTYPDFGWTHASGVIGAYGVDGLIRFAREKREPLHFGRADILLAAGKRLVSSDAEAATRINAALFDMITGASAFETPDLANAATELAMYRCHLEDFDRARAKTSAPNNLRYAFWRARMSGYPPGLTARITNEADSEDTRHVRQVLDGYRTILELGYCNYGADPS